jgi:hypothetical protein
MRFERSVARSRGSVCLLISKARSSELNKFDISAINELSCLDAFQQQMKCDLKKVLRDREVVFTYCFPGRDRVWAKIPEILISL